MSRRGWMSSLETLFFIYIFPWKISCSAFRHRNTVFQSTKLKCGNGNNGYTYDNNNNNKVRPKCDYWIDWQSGRKLRFLNGKRSGYKVDWGCWSNGIYGFDWPIGVTSFNFETMPCSWFRCQFALGAYHLQFEQLPSNNSLMKIGKALSKKHSGET